MRVPALTTFPESVRRKFGSVPVLVPLATARKFAGRDRCGKPPKRNVITLDVSVLLNAADVGYAIMRPVCDAAAEIVPLVGYIYMAC